MKTYRFLVTYTNDARQTEVKARNEDEAVYLLGCRAKKALLQIVSTKLIAII